MHATRRPCNRMPAVVDANLLALASPMEHRLVFQVLGQPGDRVHAAGDREFPVRGLRQARPAAPRPPNRRVELPMASGVLLPQLHALVSRPRVSRDWYVAGLMRWNTTSQRLAVLVR